MRILLLLSSGKVALRKRYQLRAGSVFWQNERAHGTPRELGYDGGFWNSAGRAEEATMPQGRDDSCYVQFASAAGLYPLQRERERERERHGKQTQPRHVEGGGMVVNEVREGGRGTF